MKICVADDEWEVRRSIIAKLNDSGLDAEVFDVGFGKEALEGILAVRPELAILDIRMPEMDGLSLLQTVKRAEPGIQAVMLTGYSEFTYAKQAIHLGAMDYLLKPVDREELRGIVLKVADGLANRLREELLYLYACMEGGRSGAYVELNRSLAGLWYDGRTAKRIRFAEAAEGLTEGGEACKPGGTANSGAVGVIASVLAGEEVIRIEAAGEGSAGSVFYEGKDAARIWAREQAAWRRHRFFGSAASRAGAVWSGPSGPAAGKAAGLRKGIAEAAGAGSPELAQLYAAWCAQVELLAPEEAKRECAELLTLLEAAGKTEALRNPAGSSGEPGGWAEWVESFSSWAQLQGQIGGLLESCAAKDKDSGEEMAAGSEKWFRQALRLMDSPANDGLTLESAAQAIGVHPVTLSRIFKRRTGVNFVRFLISRRLQQAKTLLLESNETVASVAMRAGYADLRHFNRLFKEEFGQTPGEFRKTRSRDG